MCGEKFPVLPLLQKVTGSPPRVRGEVFKKIKITEPPGITPACAGRSAALAESQQRSRDHPRVCGEKYNDRVSLRDTLGSPPRVRGEAG